MRRKGHFRRVVEVRMALVAVKAGGALITARWWLLRLECGHEVVRQRKAGVGRPRRCHCEMCQVLIKG